MYDASETEAYGISLLIHTYIPMTLPSAAPPIRRNLNVKVTQSEYEQLTAHCIQQGRTKTDLIREMIRGLVVYEGEGSGAK